MPPIIGITFSSESIRGTSKNYIHAIEEFGGIPRKLYPDVPDSEYADIDGLLLTGGPDIDPAYYGEERHETTDINAARDELELPLYKWAIEKDLPVFGICRGIQIMNVAIGGSLYQDIPSQFTCRLTHKILVNSDDSWHSINKIQPGSLLNQITGESITEVNSRHHQALKVIGKGFTVTAQSKDGIIEAIEDRSKRFVLGVQYHPERMTQTAEFREHRRKLFEAFIKAASR
ncbi:MAG: gamma-glutamyl-gamma-aminobutyrate hydrolase family protein [Candidatus Poribacteria bacterium]|nr:gamma-glutamyl-gamma-aminobutyrate hydrolase family protein [Candidatus Poribacteria bacterium]